jgi:superfamily II DNA or RNA helicase
MRLTTLFLIHIDESPNGSTKSNRSCRILGFTATPDRADKLALGSVFEAVAFDYNIRQAVDDGWLVPIKNNVVSVDGLDFSNVRSTAGDLNKKDLAAVMEFEEGVCTVSPYRLWTWSETSRRSCLRRLLSRRSG